MKSVTPRKGCALFLVAFSALTLLMSCQGTDVKEALELDSDEIVVYGYVKDIDGKPLRNAEVKVPLTGEVVKTDDDGLYRVKLQLGELPKDAVVTVVASHDGFVPRKGTISFAEPLTSKSEFLIQKRAKRLDLVLVPPAQIEVEVVDKNDKPVVNSIVRISGDPVVANYLGISQEEFILSLTSASTPVSITEGIPAIPGAHVHIFAFPPKGKEYDYSVGFAEVDLTEGRERAKVVLGVEALKILYTSVDSKQFITPDSNINVIFSKPVTGVGARIGCSASGNHQVFVEIASEEQALVTVKPAGVMLGTCVLTIDYAYGKDGESLFVTPPPYTFVSYDPAAPKGLACPIPVVALKEYSSRATGWTFDDAPGKGKLIVFQSTVDDFNLRSFTLSDTNSMIITWDPPVMPGVIGYKIYKIKKSDIAVGRVVWQEVGGVNLAFRLSERKYYATINIAGETLSYGDGVSYAIIPVNINQEDICSLENAPTINVEDSIGPEIAGASIDVVNYAEGERTIRITFSEPITRSNINLSSRTFEIREISETISDTNPSQVEIKAYLKPLSTYVLDDSENDNTTPDNKLVVSLQGAKRLWLSEWIDVVDSSGTKLQPSYASPDIITGIAKVGDRAEIWLRFPFVGDARKGYIIPAQLPNDLQNPYGRLYVDSTGKIVIIPNTTRPGLTVGDKIRVLTKEMATVTVKAVAELPTGRYMEIEENISVLADCISPNSCGYRSLNPDIKIDASDILDRAGNQTRWYSMNAGLGYDFGFILWVW